MKTIGAILLMSLLFLLLVEAGCESATPDVESAAKLDNYSDVSIYTRYAPVKIKILPLTEFIIAGDTEGSSKIRVYVSFLDAFGCQSKAPGVFRFELYRHVPRRAEPKGKRIVIWPDIDLTRPTKNNRHWRDFLRAYEFDLDFEPQSNQSCILQVTSLCPDGKRLSAEFGLKYPE